MAQAGEGGLLTSRLKSERIELEGDTFSYAGDDWNVGVQIMSQPDNAGADWSFYFEVDIINTGKQGAIAVGLVPRNYPLDKQPGWINGSIGYHMDDGCIYEGKDRGTPYGPKCAAGDIIGCGIEEGSDDEVLSVFFTRNGKKLDTVFMAKPVGWLYPAVGMISPGEKVRFHLDAVLRDESGYKSILGIVGKAPAHWNTNVRGENKFYQLIVLQGTGANSQEYMDIQTLFMKTMNRGTTINSISRIQNADLWNRFMLKKTSMEQHDKTSLETRVFHGTSQAYTDPICHHGFDFRISGRSTGTAYGKGSYFGKDAVTSSRYTRDGLMFVARALLGDYALGSGSYVRPPPRDPSKPDLDFYDSCVNNVANPTIFVVFSQEQVYPEYLISYK